MEQVEGKTMKSVDLVIKNGTICCVDKSNKTLKLHSIIINNGKILDITDLVSASLKYEGKKEIDATNCIVMPGLVNTHTHSPLSFLRGVVDDLPLVDWLNSYIWPIENYMIDKEFVHHATKLAIAEMLLSGTTTFNDSYFFSDEVASVAHDFGIRCISGEIILNSVTPNMKTPKEGLEYFKKIFNKWKGSNLITISIAPHSIYGCSEEIIKKASNLSDKLDTLLNIHLSESKHEFIEIKEKYNCTPVALLKKWGVLNSKVIAAHCVHVTDSDIDILSTYKVGVAHNPESNLKLGNGIAPIAQMLKSGIKVGLGTDGAASNNDLSLLSEVDFAAKLQKGITGNPSLLNSIEGVQMLTINGAKALQLEKIVGSIEVGKCADIILVDHNKPHLTPLFNPYSHIVYSATSSDVRDVIINGEIIVKDRLLVNHDINQIYYNSDIYREKIIKAIGLK